MHIFFSRSVLPPWDTTTMEALVSPIVSSLYVEAFERRALESATHSPPWWKCYLADTHTVLVKAHVPEFKDHLNRAKSVCAV